MIRFMKNEGTVLQTEIINNEIADLIPIACHYNQDTILTKQGDLIQILRITGFEDNEDQFDRINIRDAIRKAIKKHIPSADYAVYFHILRNERDIMPQSDFELEYAVEINKR